MHRYYQEQYQLNGGKQNRYTTGSDAVGLTQGVYDTRALPIYKYLHSPGHPDYAIADRFFQAAFGGSFLTHQWLIAAATPTYPGAPENLHSIVDANGMPTSYPLYTATSTVRDAALTAACGGSTPAGLGCGDFAVNTIQPFVQPFSSPAAVKLPLQTAPTIGDRLSAKGIDWAWYSGGWSNANGDVGAPGWTNGTAPGPCTDPNTATGAVFPNCPDKLFQFHHQPFNYFANYASGPARAAHLRDEAEFEAAALASKKHCALKPVSIIKPIGAENEHPGYASEHSGSSHLVDLLSAIQSSRCAKDTMVIVTYDEFGGQWDHVSPPGLGGTGPSDQWGPSTRIPALVLAPRLRDDFVVDRVSHDTTSILATIEHRFGLDPLTSRDGAVSDLSSVFSARGPHRHRYSDRSIPRHARRTSRDVRRAPSAGGCARARRGLPSARWSPGCSAIRHGPTPFWASRSPSCSWPSPPWASATRASTRSPTRAARSPAWPSRCAAGGRSSPSPSSSPR